MKTFMETRIFAQFNLEIYRNPVRPTTSDAVAGPEIKPTYIQHRPFNLVATRVFKKTPFFGNSRCTNKLYSSLGHLEPELELF